MNRFWKERRIFYVLVSPGFRIGDFSAIKKAMGFRAARRWARAFVREHPFGVAFICPSMERALSKVSPDHHPHLWSGYES